MLKGRLPTSGERKYMDAVSQLPCVACEIEGLGASPAELHHPFGKTKSGAHYSVIPLFFNHHRHGADNEQFTSRHPYKARFEERYGPETQLVIITRQRLRDRGQGHLVSLADTFEQESGL